MSAPVASATAVADFLRRHEEKSQLRFITCGSVDDGKSTLIGRLLYESRALLDDQLATLQGTGSHHGGGLDFASLVDGLAAEREQGITIDVAYRFFATGRRRFIVADCPGHEQYTRNMATGASTAELAVVLVDARKGVLTQTRRHTYIVSLLGIRHVVLAVNKMDLVGFGQARFEEIATAYRQLASDLGVDAVTCIPVSARDGDNLCAPSPAMPWYRGPSLLEHLETVELTLPGDAAGGPAMRLPVQWVCRPHQDFRGLAGTLSAGSVEAGMAVQVLPSGQRSRVRSVHVGERRVEQAVAGQSVLLELEHDIDAGRGDVVVAAATPPPVFDAFAVHLLWLSTAELSPGGHYLLRNASGTVNAQVAALRHRVDVNTQARQVAQRLALNEVGVCELVLDRRIAFEPYARSRELGGFVLVDRHSNETVAAGFIDAPLPAARDLHWHASGIDRRARGLAKGQVPRCVWLTGLSGAGKSTIANHIEQVLHARGGHAYVLDGDNLRFGLNSDLGFDAHDRAENVRRTAEVAKLMVDAGLLVVVCLISPFRADRAAARRVFDAGSFIEVFVDAPLAVAEARDPKGLYARARDGLIPDFTGIGSPYEPPDAPELHLDTTAVSAEDLALRVVEHLSARTRSD